MATRVAMGTGSGWQLDSEIRSCAIMRHKIAAAGRCNRFETKMAASLTLAPLVWPSDRPLRASPAPRKY